MFKVEVEERPGRRTSRARKSASAASSAPAQLEEGVRVPEAGPGNQLRGGEAKQPCPLVKVKPTSAGRRALVKVVNPRPAQGRAGRRAGREPEARLGPQQQRPHHDAAQGRRPQAALPDRRLQAQQGRHRGQGRAARIRPEPQREHRAPAVRGRRAPLHHRAARRRGRARSSCRASKPPIKPGNCLPLRNIPVGTTIHCVEMQPGKGAQIARSAGARRAAPRARRHLRAAAPALGRDPQGARRLPRRRSAKSATRSTTCARSARPAPSAGAASVRRCAASR